MSRIRTLLIDDSAFMRKVISDIITSDADLDLVGTAANGKEGSDLALQLKPDVVVTDMVMPEYDGMYVVNSVMESRPVPIILLSSLEKTNSRIFDALQSGAFEFIDKPTELDSLSVHNYPLLNLIKQAFRTDITLLKAKQLAQRNTNAHTFDSRLHYEIIAMGASTGGPGVIESIVANLPKNLQIPVIIAQHMPHRFLETFAERLSNYQHLPVKVARNGEVLQGGTIYLASGEQNTRVEIGMLTGTPTIAFTSKRYPEFNNPSVNCLFESVAEAFGPKSIGVILTGMGKDGQEGLLKIKNSGGFTIAQDEDSCIVYGMPKAAVDSGAVKQTVRLKEIPGFIISCL
jgi:two-component system chemotaxis response regulator CheB